MSYIIPTDELTIQEMTAMRGRAQVAAKLRASRLLNVPESSLEFRHAETVADFGCATDQWNTTPLAAVNTAYSVFPAAAGNPVLGVRRIAVFYKCGVETVPSPVSLLSFRQGAAAGTTRAVFDLEQLVNKTQVDGYFSEVVVYDPQEVLNIVVTCRIATGLLARVTLGCWIVEPVGAITSS